MAINISSLLQGLDPEQFCNIGISPIATGWCQSVCEKISQERKIPFDLKTARGQTSAALNFLSFYSTGKLPENAKDTVLAMAHIIYKDSHTSPEHLVWPEEMYSKDDSLCSFTLKGNQFNTSEASTSQEECVVVAQYITQNTTGPLLKFVMKCIAVLETSSSTQLLSMTAVRLLRLLNVLALTMLRAVTEKNESRLQSAFLETNIKRKLVRIDGDRAAHYAPPCKQCIHQLPFFINKINSNICSTFAKIVMLWINQKEENPKVHEILWTATLSHNAWNGMGIIQMVSEICDYFNINWETIKNISSRFLTGSSWVKIGRFYAAYRGTEGEDKTFPWARVINDAYFSDLHVKHHIRLASLLFESIVYVQGNRGIEKAHWAVKEKMFIKTFIAVSTQLRDILIELKQKSNTERPAAASVSQSNS